MYNWKKTLKKLGLSENEANLYLISLENGPDTVQNLSKLSNLSRVTVYALVENLKNQGLMTSVEKGKKQYITAESPDRLMTYSKKKLEEIKSTVYEIKAGLNELKLKAKGDKPVVKLYEGSESINIVAQDVIKKKPKYIYEFEDLAVFRTLDEYNDQTNDDSSMVKKYNIETKQIFRVKESMPKKYHETERIFGFVDDDEFSGSITVYDNNVALSAYKDKRIAVLIESPEIAKTCKKLISLASENKKIKEIKKISSRD